MQSPNRITHLDAVRGVAVMGILIMNAVSFFLGNTAYFDISSPDNQGAVDWLVAGLGEVFADQKFMALFSLLFGASIILFCERAEAKGRAGVRLSLWRNFLLFVIGLIHGAFWVGDILLIYEVHNTFGDIHSYVGKLQAAEDILHAQKLLHVSPFFPVSGEYRLMVRAGSMNQPVRVLMRYVDRGKAQLTATLRGMPERLTTKGIVRGLLSTRQWPLRPLVSIHVEAMKLWMKRVTFFRRPEPPQPWSEAHHGMKK